MPDGSWLTAVVLVCALTAHVAAVPAPAPFTPASQYRVTFDWIVPTMPGLVEAVDLVYDGLGGNEAVSYDGGMNTNLFVTVDGAHRYYQVSPTASSPEDVKFKCFTHGQDNEYPFMFSAFPANVSAMPFVGTQVYDDIEVNVYAYSATVPGASPNNYTFMTDAATGAPVAFVTVGFEDFAEPSNTGSPSDSGGFGNSPTYAYSIVRYVTYTPGYFNASAFDVPAACAGKGARVDVGSVTTPRQLAHQITPGVVSDDALFEEYTRLHRRHYRTTAERTRARDSVLAAAQQVRVGNLAERGGGRFVLNGLADRSERELARRRMRPRAATPIGPDDRVYVPRTRSVSELPPSLDWREFGAVNRVQDQNDCGSCFAFGSTAAFNSHHFLKYGAPLLEFSMQWALDCTWPEGNEACDGGSISGVYKGVTRLGGWPSLADYPYLMNDGVCHAANFSAQCNGGVKVPKLDEHALMDALVHAGPVAVSVDSTAKWNFWGSGVLYDPLGDTKCTELNHIVLVIGYGDEPPAQAGGESMPYWLILNEWSEFWADGGVVKLSRKHNNCGTLCDPEYPIVA